MIGVAVAVVSAGLVVGILFMTARLGYRMGLLHGIESSAVGMDEAGLHEYAKALRRARKGIVSSWK